MPFIEHKNAKIYYEEEGKGEPILSTHGLMEDTTYWSAFGVTTKLAEQYRVISFDMRAHGRSSPIDEKAPKNYDVETMADDIDALADHLGIKKFHLLCHATSGMFCSRYAMTRSDRLISLMLTDTGSATQPEMFSWRELTEAEKKQGEQAMQFLMNATDEQRNEIRENELKTPIEDIMKYIKQNPDVWTFKWVDHPNKEEMYKVIEGWQRRQNRRETLHFRDVFYTDPDPKVELLRQIKCPTLILIGEFDIIFLKPSELMAKEIPENRHVIIKDAGHMLALNKPEETTKEILDFLDCVKQTGKAN